MRNAAAIRTFSTGEERENEKVQNEKIDGSGDHARNDWGSDSPKLAARPVVQVALAAQE